jgi:hypothetical protein
MLVSISLKLAVWSKNTVFKCSLSLNCVQARLLASQTAQLALPAPVEAIAPAQPILLMLPAPVPAFNPVFPALDKLREAIPVTNVRAA